MLNRIQQRRQGDHLSWVRVQLDFERHTEKDLARDFGEDNIVGWISKGYFETIYVGMPGSAERHELAKITM